MNILHHCLLPFLTISSFKQIEIPGLKCQPNEKFNDQFFHLLFVVAPENTTCCVFMNLTYFGTNERFLLRNSLRSRRSKGKEIRRKN